MRYDQHATIKLEQNALYVVLPSRARVNIIECTGKVDDYQPEKSKYLLGASTDFDMSWATLPAGAKDKS